MTARTGLANLITELRAWTNAGSADYTLAGATYWTDDQLQTELDRHRSDLNQWALSVVPEQNESGDLVYLNYYAPRGYYEEASGGTAVWTVEDGLGVNVGTAGYTVNYEAGHLLFNSDTTGSALYLTARKYDLPRAAAGIWRKKAAHVSERFDWSSDNHQVSASQLQKQYLEMAASYEHEAGAQFVRLRRADLNVYTR